MTNFKQHLGTMLRKYGELLKKAREEQSKKIPGFLEINDSYDPPQYYHRLQKDGDVKQSKKYLARKQMDFVKKLAQQSYDKKVEALLESRVQQFRKLYQVYEDEEVDGIYERLKPSRKALVCPIVPTLQQQYEAWKNKTYEPTHYCQENKIFETKQGETVRSKTEKILADTFFDEGIFYKYECPLRVGEKTIYPDFTFFDWSNGKEIYWEHFGMMDDPTYLKAAIQKIDFYDKQGVTRYARVITTFEAQCCPLDYKAVQALIHNFLMPKKKSAIEDQ